MKKVFQETWDSILFLALFAIAVAVMTSCAPSRAFYSATPGVTDGGPYYRGVPGGSDIGGNGFPTYDYDFPIRGPRR